MEGEHPGTAELEVFLDRAATKDDVDALRRNGLATPTAAWWPLLTAAA